MLTNQSFLVFSNSMASSSSSPRFIIGLDFGTTYSGFAYVRITNPKDVSVTYNWPDSEVAGVQYCKTKTSLWYCKNSGGLWEVKGWGWPAEIGYASARQEAAKQSLKGRNLEEDVGQLCTLFKLDLAEEREKERSLGQCGPRLPANVTVEMAISDYLENMASFVLEELKRGYADVKKTDLEWAITVPAMWSDRAKQRMKMIAKRAKMVEDESKVNIVLEPEAAASYCHHKKLISFERGDRFMILDAGGGTVDIVVHEKVGDGMEVKEVTRSDGGLYGSSLLDENFLAFLDKKTGCSNKLIEDNPQLKFTLLKNWDPIKRAFKGDQIPRGFEAPLKLYDMMQKLKPSDGNGYIEITLKDMTSIMDPIIDKIAEIVKKQLELVRPCKAIILVGGFGQNQYLKQKIELKFSKDVEMFIQPENAGSAICHGAVLETLCPNRVVERKSKKTYGIQVTGDFREVDNRKAKKPETESFTGPTGSVCCFGFFGSEKKPEDDGLCHECFETIVKIGELVSSSKEITRKFRPGKPKQKILTVRIFSSTLESPLYTYQDDVEKELEFEVDISSFKGDMERVFDVGFWFGKSSIEVTVQGEHGKVLGKGKK